MFDVLNAATVPQKFSQRRLSLQVRLPPHIVAIEHQQIESAGSRIQVIHSTVQGVEIRQPLKVKPNNFSIKNCRALDLCRRLDNPGITLRPVRAVDRVETHPSITDMDLQPVAIMLQFVRPAWP